MTAYRYILFLYCFLGMLSEKCVYAALEMKANTEEETGVVRVLEIKSAGTREIYRRMSDVSREHYT